MKTVFQYIRFFIYTTYYWNIWLAFFMLYHDIRGAFRYGLRKTFARVPLKHLTITGGDTSRSSPYEAVSYYMLEKLLSAFRQLSSIDSIVDLGSGKGRVLVAAAHFGFRHITGIDFARELCEEATRNMQNAAASFPGLQWRVINANVLDYPIGQSDSVFFLFNPFVEETLAAFLARLEESCRQYPRHTYFIYASPRHSGVLEQKGYNLVFDTRLMNLKGSIFEKPAGKENDLPF